MTPAALVQIAVFFIAVLALTRPSTGSGISSFSSEHPASRAEARAAAARIPAPARVRRRVLRAVPDDVTSRSIGLDRLSRVLRGANWDTGGSQNEHNC